MSRNIEAPRPPGSLLNILTLGALGRQHRVWGDYTKSQEKASFNQQRQTERENVNAFCGPIESSLGVIRRLTRVMPYFPTDLNFAVLERSCSEDPQNRFWDLLEIPEENGQLLILNPNPLNPEGEFDPQFRPRLHLLSPRQSLCISTGQGYGGHFEVASYIYEVFSYIRSLVGEDERVRDNWRKAGLISKSPVQEATVTQELLIFLIAHLNELHNDPIDQQIALLKSLRPEIDYGLLQQEVSAQRDSLFEYTRQEFLTWMTPQDAENLNNLVNGLDNFTRDKGSSFGLVATGSITDPTRRWSLTQTSEPEIGLLFYLATGEKNNPYDPGRLDSFLQKELGWKCGYDEETGNWCDYSSDYPPYFKLQPKRGRLIELYPEWEPRDTPQAIRALISEIRYSDRSGFTNPYFSVLSEPVNNY